jgi:thiamine-monophosphate kinase
MLLSCDMVVEGVHFRREWYREAPELLGRKALAVNISDIASMGGRPRFCLVTLGADPGVPVEFLRRVYAGLVDLAGEWGVSLVGGDTVSLQGQGGGLLLDVFITGEVEPGRALLRSGAKPGDLIAVTGDFGLARAGLELLELPPEAGEGHIPGADRTAAIGRQLEPPVRLRESAALAALGPDGIHALSDTSDGLATQVHLICEASGVGALVHGDQVPVSPVTAQVARALSDDPLSWALFGGEDYELIAAIPPQHWGRAAAAVAAAGGGTALTAVGRFTAGRSIELQGAFGSKSPLAFGGWDHFSKASRALRHLAPGGSE